MLLLCNRTWLLLTFREKNWILKHQDEGLLVWLIVRSMPPLDPTSMPPHFHVLLKPLFCCSNMITKQGVLVWKKKEIGFILAEKFLWKDGDVDVVPHGNRILLRPWFVLVIDHDPSVALIHYGSTPRSQCDPYSSQ